jgi:uncharacterized SAM-binding protein YcdF (DUF218 family)
MFQYASKFLPLLIYPLGLSCLLLTASLIIKRDSRWSTRLSFLALFLLFVGGNRVISTFIIYSLEKQYPPLQTIPVADVIVVLGGGTRPRNTPRLHHEVTEAGDRLLYAARLYHAGAAPVIIVSGGQAKWSGPTSDSGAVAMADILTLTGVPEESIILEGISSNTYENALETTAILEKEGFQTVILVTSAMHMPRSAAIFNKFDVNLIPAPADFLVTDADIRYFLDPDPRIQLMNLVPATDSLYWESQALKEYIGIIVYKLRGWL